MAYRTAIVSVLCFAAFTALYLSTTSSDQLRMGASTMDQIACSPEVDLSKNSDTSTIKITIRNNDPDHAVSLLTWDTPLDSQVINTGVLQLEDAETGKSIPSPGLMLNRVFPPPRGDLVEIAPSSSISKDIALKSPWIPSDGKQYRVQMRGDWKAIWAKPAAEVTDEELSAMTGEKAMHGSFQTESVEIQLQQ